MSRARARDLGIVIGALPTGPYNAITDVEGVLVGHKTVIHDEPRVARTGVTVILPRAGTIQDDSAFAGAHSFNGCGEMTGLLWVEESGMLTSPVVLTNTAQVGLMRDSLIRYSERAYGRPAFHLAVVAETWDGWLNDIHAFHLTEADLFAAMDRASGGRVAEGNVGGGTGMICHEFKGGIGTSSRVVEVEERAYTVGALVQANYGDREQLRVDGVPVGMALGADEVPTLKDRPRASSSIVIVIATDAPLLPHQCKRLARRATVGLARAGGVGHNGSGDIFLAFSTANHLPVQGSEPHELRSLRAAQLNPLFEAVADAVEESIVNALVAAETMVGFRGNTVHALPHDALQAVIARYRNVAP